MPMNLSRASKKYFLKVYLNPSLLCNLLKKIAGYRRLNRPFRDYKITPYSILHFSGNFMQTLQPLHILQEIRIFVQSSS
jgi:hypothetical protein